MTSTDLSKMQNILLILISLILLGSCSTSKIRQIKSDNHNDRIRYLVIHHTTIDYQKSVRALTRKNGVSSHYLIPERKDKSYPSKKLEVVQLVDEKDRAWHAGRSYWQGQNNLNDQSIGIELVYLSPCGDADEGLSPHSGLNRNAVSNKICFYPDFDDQQIELLIVLIHDILKRNPDITPSRIIAHADIAPGRKVDPGPRFPWQRLYKAGIGAWYNEETVTRYWNQFRNNPPSTGVIQAALRTYGYGVIETGILDASTINALTVFQMHFRPWEVTGTVTPQTSATLFALIERYFPRKIDKLQLRLNKENPSNSLPVDRSQKGQFKGQFPQHNLNSRLLVNNRKIFKAYKGMGQFTLTSLGALSADIYINGKNISQHLDLKGIKAKIINIGEHTINGFNTLKVENVVPKNSHILIQIPFPELVESRAELSGFSPAKLQQIDDLIRKDIALGFPGAALLIVKDGKIIKDSIYGYSNRYHANGEPLPGPLKIQSDTLFDMASNTKMFATNYALMKLVSEGKLDINMRISRYIPEYSGQGRNARTVKDLLTHSAGYPATVRFYREDNKLGQQFFSQNKRHTHYLLAQRVPFEIGKGIQSTYSDIDYMLLGMIIERITGKALDSYVESEIYKPLGLTHSMFNPLQKGIDKMQIAATELQGNTRAGKVHFQNIRHQVIQGEVHDEKAFYSMGGVSGHAGLFSTAKDIAILASVMLNRGGYGENNLFDKSTIDQFTKPSDLNITMGFGWRRAGNGERVGQYGPYASPYAYGHTGWTGTVIIIDPWYDLIIVLLTNKKHSPMIKNPKGDIFFGDTFETGKYGSIISLVYEAFLEKA